MEYHYLEQKVNSLGDFVQSSEDKRVTMLKYVLKMAMYFLHATFQ